MVVMVFISFVSFVWSFVHFYMITIRTNRRIVYIRSLAHSLIPSRSIRERFRDSAYLRDLLCHVRFGWDAIIYTQWFKCCLHTVCPVLLLLLVLSTHICVYACVCVWMCTYARDSSAAYMYVSICVAHVSAHMPLSHTHQLFLSLSFASSRLALPHSFMHAPSLSLTRTHTHTIIFLLLLWILKSLVRAHIIISYFLAAINKLRFPTTHTTQLVAFELFELVQAV